jgi:nucleoid DNA-binding protein
MQELIQQIADKAGITPEQATIALQTMQEYMAQHKEQQKEGEDANKNSFFENIKEKAEELFEKAKDSGLAAKAEEVFEKIKKKF